MTTPLELADALQDLYHRVHRLINQSMNAQGVSLARSKFLMFLKCTGPSRSTDIADALGYAPRTVTEAIDGLERDGLVARNPDLHDRRAKIVTITPLGKSIFDAAEQPRHKMIEEIFAALDPNRQQQLLEIITILAEKTDEISARWETGGE